MKTAALTLVAMWMVALGLCPPSRADWLYTQVGTGYGVKNVGLVLRDYQRHLVVLGRAGNLANLEEGYEVPAPSSFASEDKVLAKYGLDKRLTIIRKVGENNFPHVSQLVADQAGNLYGIGTIDGDARLLDAEREVRLAGRGGRDLLVLKWTRTLRLDFVRRLGGADSGYASGLALDPSGNVVIVGEFSGRFELPVGTATAILETPSGRLDPFLLKLDQHGHCLWARQLSGATSCTPPGVGVDRFGNCYVTGGFESVLRLQEAVVGSTLHGRGGWDFYLAKFDRNGGLIWGQQGGGPDGDYGLRVLLDEACHSFVTGRFGSEAIFGSGQHSVKLTPIGKADIFMACYDDQGNLLGALRVGGEGATIDKHWTIVMDELGNRYLVGGVADETKVWRVSATKTEQRTQTPARADGVTEGRRTIVNPPSRFESITRGDDGSIQIVLEGNPEGTYIVEASVDLREWVLVSTGRITHGRILIEDARAAELPMCFYRIRQP